MSQAATESDFEEWSLWKKLTRRKLRNYLFLDKKLQFNFALLLAVIGGINAFYFSFLFYFYAQDSFERVARYIPDFAFTESLFQAETRNRLITVIFIGLFQLVLVLLLGLFFSHRIAGPLYAMGAKIRELGRGNVPPPVTLRKDDLLTTFADQLNETLAALSERKMELETAIHELKDGKKDSALSRLTKLAESAPAPAPSSPSE